jgi:hypothetical protein
MSISKNTIRFSDISSAPIKVKYSASYTSQSLADFGITINRGFNHPMTVTGSLDSNALKYSLIQQLYYKNYISGSLLGSGSAYDSYDQSTAASGSGDEDVRYFPTGSNDQIGFLYIPRSEFGEQISRKSFNLTPLLGGNPYNLIDDGNGNLVDTYNNYKNVGNIFYSQGVVIITDPNYVCIVQDPNFQFYIQAIYPTPSPTPTVSLTPFLTPTFSPSKTPSVSITPSSTGAAVSVTPQPTVSLSKTPSVTVSPSASPSVSVTPSISITPTFTPSVTPSVSITPSPTPSKTPNLSFSVTPSITPTFTPTISRTPTITPSVSITPILGNTIGTYYTPCFLQSTGFPVPTANNVYFPVGVTDISAMAGVAGKYLYQSYNTVWTNITAIADASGNIYNVNSSGQVLSPATSHC